MSNDFLPDGYSKPATPSNYLKLQDGENKIRIMSKPILGFVDWSLDKKPIRFKMDAKPEKSVDPKKPIKHFWAFVVWDYATNAIKIAEITQGGIQTGIMALSKDSDWGSIFDYDVKINRSGKDLETKYTVTPVPKKEIPKEATEAFSALKINLEALFTNGDPFATT